MAPVPDLESIAAGGAETHERFVADSVAMDRAWMAGKYDEWLADYRKRTEEEFRDADEDNGGTTAEV